MIFFIVGISILLYGIKNYHKAFLIFMLFKVVLNNNISVISIPGVPLLTMDMFLSLCFTALFWVKKDTLLLEKQKFPYSKAFLFLFLSWSVSAIFSVAGFSVGWSEYVGSVCTDILLVIIMWKVIIKESDYKFLLSGFTILFFIAAIYSFYCKAISWNPIIEWESTLIEDQSRAVEVGYMSENTIEGRGIRISSFFSHPIGAGMNFAMYFILIMVTYIKMSGFRIPRRKFSLLVALLCLPCVLLSNCRASIVFILIALFGCVEFNNKRFRNILIVLIISFIVAGPYFLDYWNVIASIFDSTAQEEAGGSNLEMRLGQLAASYQIMLIQPLTGLGYKFQLVISQSLVLELLGMESIWFVVMTKYGIIGIISTLYYMWVSVCSIPRRYKSIPLFFFSLAFWVVYTMTSLPGMLLHFYFLIIFFFIKHSKIFKDNTSL